MHSVHVSSQLFVSVLFIAVPTNTENFKFFLHLLFNSTDGIGSYVACMDFRTSC